MPGHVPLGDCLNCGKPISVGDSGYVYPSCECMGRRQLSQEEAPAYVRVRLQCKEAEEILALAFAAVGRTQENLRRIRIAHPHDANLSNPEATLRVIDPAPEVPRIPPDKSVYEQMLDDGLFED